MGEIKFWRLLRKQIIVKLKNIPISGIFYYVNKLYIAFVNYWCSNNKLCQKNRQILKTQGKLKRTHLKRCVPLLI